MQNIRHFSSPGDVSLRVEQTDLSRSAVGVWVVVWSLSAMIWSAAPQVTVSVISWLCQWEFRPLFGEFHSFVLLRESHAPSFLPIILALFPNSVPVTSMGLQPLLLRFRQVPHPPYPRRNDAGSLAPSLSSLSGHPRPRTIAPANGLPTLVLGQLLRCATSGPDPHQRDLRPLEITTVILGRELILKVKVRTRARVRVTGAAETKKMIRTKKTTKTKTKRATKRMLLTRQRRADFLLSFVDRWLTTT